MAGGLPFITSKQTKTDFCGCEVEMLMHRCAGGIKKTKQNTVRTLQTKPPRGWKSWDETRHEETTLVRSKDSSNVRKRVFSLFFVARATVDGQINKPRTNSTARINRQQPGGWPVCWWAYLKSWWSRQEKQYTQMWQCHKWETDRGRGEDNDSFAVGKMVLKQSWTQVCCHSIIRDSSILIHYQVLVLLLEPTYTSYTWRMCCHKTCCSCQFSEKKRFFSEQNKRK